MGLSSFSFLVEGSGARVLDRLVVVGIRFEMGANAKEDGKSAKSRATADLGNIMVAWIACDV